MVQNLFSETSYDINRVFEFQATGSYSPTRVIFGCHSIDRIPAEAKKYVSGNVLLLTSRYHSASETVLRIQKNLKTDITEVFIFAGIGAEPGVETANQIFAEYAGENISLIIGIGGGSVMDISKLMVPCLFHKFPPGDVLKGKATVLSRGTPLFLVPTTAGTGSEVTPFFVVSDGKEKVLQNNPVYYPELAFVDPFLTVTMPPTLTAITGMDALSHAIEGMMHLQSNPFSDILCLGAVTLTGNFLRRAVSRGDDMEARFHIALASVMAQLGMVMSGATYAHSVTYILTKYKSTPHGLGCALGLPYIMAYNATEANVKLAGIARTLDESASRLSEIEASRSAAVLVRDLMVDIGLPTTLKEYGGVRENNLVEAGRLMIEGYPRPMNPRPMNIEESIQFWHHMYEGTLA